MTLHELGLMSSGAVLLGFGVIGLFFLRFWRQTRERLFACFAAAFFILAAERVMLLVSGSDVIHQPFFYCTRLIGFLLIVWAIWDKNRTRN
jgi:hypothetical protein